MGKESPEGWPEIDKDFEASNEDIIPDGFSPQPEHYIVQETTPVAPRTGVETDSDTVDRLSDANLAPDIPNPERVFTGLHHESGVRSTPIRSGFDHEPATVENVIPKNFLTPAPAREPEVRKSWVKRLFGG